jgi:hypothetical protein
VWQIRNSIAYWLHIMHCTWFHLVKCIVIISKCHITAFKKFH